MVDEAQFSGQQEGEKIIIFARRHWYVLSQWLRVPFLLLFLSALATRFAFSYLDIKGTKAILAWPIALMPASLWILWRVGDWWNDHYIVTDRRVIHIERVYGLMERREEAHLDMIQDVTVEMPTFMANLLGFGNVLIATAGAAGTIAFNSVSDPRGIQAQIFSLITPTEGEGGEGLGDGERPAPEQGLRQFIASLFRPSIPDEPGLLVWRKHWWALFQALTSPLLALAAVVILLLLARTFLEEGLPLWANLLFALSLALIGLWILWRSIDWENDLYIVTNERVVDIEKIPLVFEHRREASLGMIQDVSYTKPSFIAQRLDFGDVRLETAAAVGLFTFDSVPHPQQVQAEIFRRLQAFRQRAQQEEERRREEEIVRLLARYHEATRKEGE